MITKGPGDRPGAFLKLDKMEKTLSLNWQKGGRPGIYFANYEGRTILLHGWPRATAYAKTFEVYDGHKRTGLIRGLETAKQYAERILAERI